MPFDGIIFPRMFDISKVEFGTPKSIDNGGKMISVNYDGNRFNVHTPPMRCPHGLTEWQGGGGGAKDGPQKRSIGASFGKYEENERLGDFHAMMTELDHLLIKQALDNSKAWFKVEHSSVDVVEALYTPLVKVSNEFRMSVGNYCEVYDGNRNLVEMDSVDLKDAVVQAIIQCNGVWIAGGRFGCTWRVVQLQVFSNRSRLPRIAFKPDEEYEFNAPPEDGGIIPPEDGGIIPPETPTWNAPHQSIFTGVFYVE